MAKHFVVRRTADKGLGTFAASNLAPGTVIMQDKVAMLLPEQFSEVTAQQCFDQLSKATQDRIMELHEGHRPSCTKLMRICKANVFGTSFGGAKLYLDISRINHSCAPNSTMEDLGEHGMESRIVAIRPIAVDEEITIRYYDSFPGVSTDRRKRILRSYHGFNCVCSSCSLQGQALRMSDARRTIINQLTALVEGHQPYDWSMIDKLTPASAESLKDILVFPRLPLSTPLTSHQVVAYNIILAWLLEAEGLHGPEIATRYKEAANGLKNQMIDQHEDIVIMSSARILQAWAESAKATAVKTTGPDSSFRKQVKENFEVLQTEPAIQILTMTATNTQYQDHCRLHGKGFAVLIGEMKEMNGRVGPQITPLSRDECRQILASRQRKQ